MQKGDYMKDLNQTKTQANLLAAFAAECMARTKYDFYAEKAKKRASSIFIVRLKRLPTTKELMRMYGTDC